jgi:hypothetical protein
VRLLGQVTLPHRTEDVPISRSLLAAGAARCALIDEGALNRADILLTGRFADANRSNPPDPAALALCCRPLRNPARYGMGAGPVHALLHLETVDSLRQQADAARELRRNLAASADVSIGVFPSWYTPADPAWADAAAVVSALCWGFYPWNQVIRQGLAFWLGEIDAAEAKLRAWFPRRRRKVAYLTPCYQVWWQQDPQWADLVPLHDTPVPLAWWRAVLERLVAGGWETFIWGMSDAGRVRGHLEVAAEVFGLGG